MPKASDAIPGVPSPVAALVAALSFTDPRVEPLRSLTRGDWEQLLSRWGVLRLMIPLRRYRAEAVPEWVRSKIDANLEDNAERLENIKACYREFLDASPEGAEHVILKGFAQYPDLIEHPRFRVQSDIDIHCPPESLLPARDTLLKLGYETRRGERTVAADHMPIMIRRSGWEWRGNPFDPEMPVSFEIHGRLWNDQLEGFGPPVAELSRFWLRRTENQFDGLRFPALATIDNVGYCALNVLRDALRDSMSVQLVYELARFLDLRSDDQQLWGNWRELHSEGLRRLETVSFLLASNLFACHLSGAIQAEVERLPHAAKVWFRSYAHSPLAASFVPNKDALWLHLSLLESPYARGKILLNRLLPSRVPPFEAAHVQKVSSAAASQTRLAKTSRYLRYAAARITFHLRILPHTLWRGAAIWWSTKGFDLRFLAFLAMWTSVNLGIYIFFFLYNLYLLDRGLRENVLGWMAGAMSLGSVVGTIPAGLLARRAGIRNAFFACTVLLSLISAIRLLVISTASLLLAALVAGIVMSILPVTLTPAIAQLTGDENRPIGFSAIFSVGVGLGIFGGPLASHLPGWLAQANPHLAGIHAKQAALLCGCCIMALAALPASRLTFPARPPVEPKLYPRSPSFYKFLIAFSLWSLAIGGFTPFFTAYFSRFLQVPLKAIGTVYSTSHIAQLLAILAAPVVFRKLGLLSGIVCAQIIASFGLFALAAAAHSSAAAAIYIGYVAFQWMSEPGVLSLLLKQVTPAEQTGASAIHVLVGNVSQAAAASLAGMCFVKFSYPPVLAVLSAIALAAAMSFHLLLGRQRVPQPPRTVPAALTSTLETGSEQ